MKHGRTACYTILKNEKKYIEKWLYYTAPFDYRVLLDTGSTDGSWELLQEYAKNDHNLIIEQKTFTPWRFDIARHYNHAMIPEDVVWCLSPDLDEYFSINTHDEMERIISAVPSITNISCDRLDVYSHVVRVGPPHHLPSNKIHRNKDYKWVQPIYEHLLWNRTDKSENEMYSDDIFLIHDQDFLKKERSELYVKMLTDEYETNPSNTWCLWFLLSHYSKSRNLTDYISSGCDYVKYHTDKTDTKYIHILKELTNIYLYEQSITSEQKTLLKNTVKNNSL